MNAILETARPSFAWDRTGPQHERAEATVSAVDRLLAPLELLMGASAPLWAKPLGPIVAAGRSYPLPRYVFAGPPAEHPTIRLGLFAGLHGDQVEGSLGLWRFLTGLAMQPETGAGFLIYCYPVCNPTGLEFQRRLSARGKDLDTEFWRGSDEPEVRVLEAELQTHAFDGIVRLQAGIQAPKFTGWAADDPFSRSLLKSALNTADTFLPRARREVGGPRRIRPGMLQSPPDARPRPFELGLVSPGQASVPSQVDAFAAALHAIMAASCSLNRGAEPPQSHLQV